MTSKIMQLAQKTIEPCLYLNKISFPQLPTDKIQIAGLGSDGSITNVACLQPKWLFCSVKNLAQKHFRQLKTKTLQVEMSFTFGTTQYIEVKDISFFENSKNNGRPLKFKVTSRFYIPVLHSSFTPQFCMQVYIPCPV